MAKQIKKVKAVAKKKPNNPRTKAKKKKPRDMTRVHARREKNKLKVLEALKGTFGIVTNAIAKVGINNDTFYEWIKQDEDFNKAVEEIQDQFDIIVDDKIKQKIIKGDGAMIRFYAGSRMKKYKRQIGFGDDDVVEPINLIITTRKTKK